MLPAPLSNWLKRTRTLVVVAGLMGGSVALADPVAIEPFNYAVPGGLNGQTGGSGFASNAWTAVSGQASPGLASGSMPYTAGTNALSTIGNKAQPAVSSRSIRNFPAPLATANQTYWVAFRVNQTDTSTLPSNHAGFSLFSGANGSGTEIMVGKPGYGATNWGMDHSGTWVQRSGSITTTGGRDALLLYKLAFTSSQVTISMWVNPTLVSESSLGSAHQTLTKAHSTTIASLRLSTGGNSVNYQFDEFRMGTTFADVARLWQPATAGDFTTALNGSQFGDTIVLQAGTDYVGAFSLPNKTTGSGWVTIQSSALSSLPPAGTRVKPQDPNANPPPTAPGQLNHRQHMPRVISPNLPNNQPAISTAAGAHHFRLIGLELSASQDNDNLTAGIVLIGNGGSAQNDLSQVPHDIVIDRCYVRSATDSQNVQRAIALHGASVDIVNSHVAGAHFVGIESQAIAGWNGPGPYDIVNNYLEAAGENIMFGGATVHVPNVVPSDILVSRNHFHIPLSWKGTLPDWAVKNHFELKSGKRVTIDGNLFENCWHDAGNQNGASIVLKTIQSSGQGNAWTVTEDITVTRNIIRNVGLGIVIAGSVNTAGGNLDGYPANVFVQDNIFDDINQNTAGNRGWWISMGSASPNVTFDHNTAFHTSSIAGVWGNDFPNFAFTNNLTNQAGYGFKGDGQGDGETTLDAYFPGAVWLKNVIQGGIHNNYQPNYPGGWSPTTLAFPATWSGVLVNQASPGANYAGWKAVAGSSWDNAGTDGRDIGADIDAVNAATAGCVSGVWP